MMPSTATALDRATGAKGQLAALPSFTDRKAIKPQTKSVLAGKLAVWLQSDDAKEWRRDRMQLWAADDDEGAETSAVKPVSNHQLKQQTTRMWHPHDIKGFVVESSRL